MKNAIIEVVYDRRKQCQTKGLGSVEIRLYFGGRQCYFSTGIDITPKQWRNGKVRGRSDAGDLNEFIDILVGRVRRAFNEQVERGVVSFSEIRESVRLKGKRSDEFLAFCESRSVIRCHGLSEARRKRYESFISFLREWGGIRRFSQVTEAAILSLDSLLIERGLKQSSRWCLYHRTLNSFLIDAHHEGLIRENPYRHLKIGRDNSDGALERRLSFDELERLKCAELPTVSLERVRDLFIFQTYTCLSYVDLVEFDVERMERSDVGYVYRGRRHKTGGDFVFLVLPAALEILQKYGGKLPILSNVKYNLFLKSLAQYAGIEKPLSSHFARHTGATLLLNAGVDMEVVAKILGHKSTEMTRRIYAKLLDSTVAHAMSAAEKNLK